MSATIMRYTRPDGSEWECQVIGHNLSGDPFWPIRIRARCIGPFAGPWHEFDTEPAWLTVRGLPLPARAANTSGALAPHN